MKETYRTINEFPNYEVSNLGNVRNKKRNEIKVPGTDGKGYLKVDLYKKSKRTTKRVHILVADAFLPKDPHRKDINHKDGNKKNNNVTNLQRCTKSENMRHAYKTGLSKPHASYGMLGKKNPNGGRKKRAVRIIETGQIFKSQTDCERFINSQSINGKSSHVNDCLRGRQKSHKGYHFEYV